MVKLLVIVRHGDYSGSENDPLSDAGIKQIRNLRKVINAFIEKKFGEKRIARIRLSFSHQERAIQSIQELSFDGEDIVITNLYLTRRSEVREPRKILEKVMGIANHYGADVVVIVAHGDMPAVVVETAHEFVTGNKLSALPPVHEACGFITDMTTGEVVPISFDSLEKKKPPQPTVPETGRPVSKGAPRSDRVFRKGGPEDDDIPF